MNIDANGDNESPDEDRGTANGVFGERQNGFPIDELKVRAANEVEKIGSTGGLQDPGVLPVQQQPQPQSQGTTVCWERFLNVRSIRVLLVENDDSTRHVVSALLRNCNYEVLEAANGLQAWKFLEDLTNNIDLVLTEVVMPFLPGIPLLNKIMSHKTRKNIPVIMMSSHDSMGLVFKCLSKGAVDFLVKPIRKNELKNLWQHVWRRCHSSSGSGSESGTQTQKSVKSKSSEKSDNSSSNDGENDGSNGLNMGNGSEDGSGTQSSWTKQAVEVDSSQAISPVDQVAECPDSTFAQVIRSNAENSGSRKIHINVARGSSEHKCETMAEDKETDKKVKFMSQSDCSLINKQLDQGQPSSNGECLFGKQKAGCGETPDPCADGTESDSTRVKHMLHISNNTTDDSKDPNIEPSLKRLRGDDTGRSVQEDRYVLRRSEQSAFSRYNSSSNIFKAPNGITGSSTIIDNSVEVAKRESAGDIQTHSAHQVVHLSSMGLSNNIDMGSSTNKLPAHAPVKKDKSEATSTISGSNPSAFKPMKNDVRYGQQQVSPLHNDMQIREFGQARGSQQESQVQHSHHPNYNHHNFRNAEQPSCNHDELSLQKLIADGPLCGSTNVLGGPVDGNCMNYSLNRSVSGSNNGSNGQNGSSNANNAAGNNAESDAGLAGKSGSGDASGTGTGNRVDENRLEHRKAALHKYQKKKKERCFTKKVRYQNRKKLAEQRPRVRGQFVKQTGTDSSNKTSD